MEFGLSRGNCCKFVSEVLSKDRHITFSLLFRYRNSRLDLVFTFLILSSICSNHHPLRYLRLFLFHATHSLAAALLTYC